MAAATSVIVLDRSNNTTCTINLHGKNNKIISLVFHPALENKFSRLKMKNMKNAQETKNTSLCECAQNCRFRLTLNQRASKNAVFFNKFKVVFIVSRF